MIPIRGIDVSRPALDPTAKTEEARAKVKSAASEFEAILVRQLLSSTELGKKKDVYADMSVDAVAKAVTAGKGLGMSESLVKSLTSRGFVENREK